MDNITHSLTGLVLARAGLNRLTPRATLLLLLSANAPDIDVLAAPWGALRYLEIHRGYTHCLLFLPLMAALSVFVTGALCRQKLRWLPAFGAACLGVLSHLLLDWTNSYGIRFLLPFSSRWFHLDINQLTDGILLIALALAVVWPLFSRLVGGEIGERNVSSGRGSALAALAFFLLFDFGRYLLHQRAVEQLTSRLYDGALPKSVAALPSTFDPLQWSGIVEAENSFSGFDVNLLHDLEPQATSVIYKRPFDEASERARSTPAFRFFQYFSRFPVWTEEPASVSKTTGTRVELSDLRFSAPGVGAFHCVALIDSRGRVLQSVFTFGSGANIGRAQ